MKSVLIISYSMPPSANIGGRRWVKFAKYLKRNGNLVKIIAAAENSEISSPWQADADTLKGDITYIKSAYPSYLGIRPSSVLDRILYRLSLVYVKWAGLGNYYDKSNFWQDDLLSAMRRIIVNHKINNVVCTVPPFRMAHTILKLKSEYPHINFIIDYRDPWSNNKTAFGFTNLSVKRFALELKCENEVVRGYDRIMAVSVEMQDYLRTFLTKEALKHKFVCVSNGYDAEDFSLLSSSAVAAPVTGRFRVVFTGTFYDKSLHVLEELIKTLDWLAATHPAVKDYFQFVFVGSVPPEALHLIESNPRNLSYQGRKQIHAVYELIYSANACALFLTDDLNYSFSTKFYEYIALKKPILSFSKEKGANAKFIEQNQLGFGVDFSTMKDVLEKLAFGKLLLPTVNAPELEKFEVSRLTAKIEDILV